MTPQIFAAMYLTTLKLRGDSWVRTGVRGHYTKTSEECAREACVLHHQDEAWCVPLMVLESGGDSENIVHDWAVGVVK